MTFPFQTGRFSGAILVPRGPITKRQWMIGMSNHLLNAKYLVSITILKS